MHEFAITQAILAIILKKARAAQALRVTKAYLTVGRLSGFVPECITLQFEVLSRGTEAAGATLSFEIPSVRLHCRKCDVDYTSESYDLACPYCHSWETDRLSGTEVRVETIEIE